MADGIFDHGDEDHEGESKKAEPGGVRGPVVARGYDRQVEVRGPRAEPGGMLGGLGRGRGARLRVAGKGIRPSSLRPGGTADGSRW